jgi:cell division GTPase FtsZ
MTMMANFLQRELFTTSTSIPLTTPVRVVGIGDVGCRAATRVFGDCTSNGITTVFCVETDSASLDRSMCDERLLLGAARFRGFGSGGDSASVRHATQYIRDNIARIVSGARCVVIMAGASGITGSNVAPIIAEIARESGAFVTFVAFMPFEFERSSAHLHAEDTVANLRTSCDAVLEVPVESSGTNTSLAGLLDNDRRYASGFVTLLESVFGVASGNFDSPSDVRSVLGDGRRVVCSFAEARDERSVDLALSDCIDNIGSRGIHPSQLDRAFVLVESATECSVQNVAGMTLTLESSTGKQTEIVLRYRKKPIPDRKARVSLIGTIREARRRLVFDEMLHRSTAMKTPQRSPVLI